MTSRWVGRIAIVALAGAVLAAPGCHGGNEEAKPAAVQVTAPPATSAVTPAATAAAAAATGDAEDSAYADDLVLLADGDPDFGDAPLAVKFTVESLVTPDMHEPKYTWSFGDGSESHEAAPTHTYTKAGDYSVTVTVVDGNGERGWDELEVEVEEAEAEPEPTK